MTISVYPRYVGPTIEYRFASLYPRWLGNIIGGVLPPELEEWLGGVVVLDEQYGAAAVGSALAALVTTPVLAVLARSARIDAIESSLLRDTTVSNTEHEVITLASKMTALYAKVRAGVDNLTTSVDVDERNDFGAKVSDEEPKI
jgi:hypothetical protein